RPHHAAAGGARGDGRPVRAPVVGIAASAGGPSALAVVLPGLAGLPAPVLVVQHLDARFADDFLGWMARISALPVEAARTGTLPSPGVVYLAPPDGHHLKLGPDGRLLLDTRPECAHRPSADELFRSIAARAGEGGIGVVLTGIGDD